MNLNLSVKQITFISSIILLLMALSYLAGKQHATLKDVKTTTQDNKTVDTHTVKTETETKKKDGTIQIVTTTDTVQSTVDKKTVDTDIKNISPKWNISAMVGEDLSSITSGPKYGLSITRIYSIPIIGPITIGGFGFTSGLIGVSLGKSF
jgi:hypothetical protein